MNPIPVAKNKRLLSIFQLNTLHQGGSNCKDSTYNAGDLGSIPGSGRTPGEGNGYPLQHSYWVNSLDRIQPYGLKKVGLKKVGHD